MEHKNIQQFVKVTSKEHKKLCEKVFLTEDSPDTLLCPACLSEEVYKGLIDIDDVLSLKAIAEYQSKWSNLILKTTNNSHKLCGEALERGDAIFNKYLEELQTMKAAYKKKIVSIGQELTSEVINEELSIEGLIKDLNKPHSKPESSEGQLLENYLRNFHKLRDFDSDRLSDIEEISEVVNMSVQELDSTFKLRLSELKTWTSSCLHVSTQRKEKQYFSGIDPFKRLQGTSKAHYIQNAHSG